MNQKTLILISVILWCGGFVIGFLFETFIISENSLERGIINVGMYTLDEYSCPFYFIKANLKVLFFEVIGVITIGISTIFTLIVNGIYFGLGIGYFLHKLSLTEILLLTLPHGIFELPAVWFAGAAGLKGPQVFIRYIKEDKFVIKKDIEEFLTLFATSVILIIIAGVIEAKITYQIAQNI